MEPFYDDNEGDTEIIESMGNAESHMDQAATHFAEAFGLDGEDHTIAERVQDVGAMWTAESEAAKNFGNGFSESVEDFFSGDGTVLGELGEAGAAVAGEVVEAASEAGMAVVGATLGAVGEIVEGFGDGLEDLGKGWDDLMDGDVVGAASHAGEAVKDIGGAVADAAEVTVEGAVDMFVELGEGAASIGAEIGEGVSEVGDAIGDAWDSLWGDDEEESEELEDEYAG